MENISASTQTENPNIVGEDVAELIIHTIIFLLGVPGNCLILRVYWTKTRKTSTHVLIMALAWADLAVCLLRIPEICSTALRIVGDKIDWTFYVEPIQDAAIVSSFVITAVIAADRYDCVCRPQRQFFTNRRAKIASVAAFIFASILNILKYALLWSFDNMSPCGLIINLVSFVAALVTIVVCYGGVYLTVRKHVKVAPILSPTSGDEIRLKPNDESLMRRVPGRPTAAKSDHSTHDKLVLLSISQPSESRISKDIHDPPMTSQAVPESPQDVTDGRYEYKPRAESLKQNITSTRTELSVVRRDTNPRQETGNGPRRAPQGFGGAVLQRKTTRMLFITSVVFLLTWLPFLVGTSMSFASSGGESTRSIFYEIVNDLRVGIFINNAVNPLIYGLANRRFRKDCREVLAKMKLC